MGRKRAPYLGTTQRSDSEDSHGQESTQGVRRSHRCQWAMTGIPVTCMRICLEQLRQHSTNGQETSQIPAPLQGDTHRASEGPA